MTNSKVFKLFHRIFHLGGLLDLEGAIWPLEKLYNSYRFCLQTFTLILAVLSLLNSQHAFEENSPDEFAYFIGTFLTLFLVVVKLAISKTQKVMKLAVTMLHREGHLNTNPVESIRTLHQNYAETFLLAVRMYMVMSIASGMVVVLIAVINVLRGLTEEECIIINCQKNLPLDTYIPFNIDRYYVWANLLQGVTAMSAATVVLAVDVIYFSFIAFTLCQVNILQHVIEKTDHYSKIMFQSIESTILEIDETSGVYYLIRECLIEHQNIIKDVIEVNCTTQLLFLVDFFVHTLQIAAFVYAAISVKEMSLKVGFTLCALIYTFLQLFLIYYYGHKLMEESVNISSSVYESNWYTSEPRIRRYLLMIMLRAQKPLAIKVGPLYEIDLNVFLKLLKTIYTYISFFLKRQNTM